MQHIVGIRRETKDQTQRRAPLAPEQVARLVRDRGLRIIVQPWQHRIFPDREYCSAGADVSEDLNDCNIIFGVKEIYSPHLRDSSVYCCFSHTIKGQEYNMPMLREIIGRKVTLFDYEMVKDERGKRLIFFGPYAGYAGMIDTLWALGRRLDSEHLSNPFSDIKYAAEYPDLDAARQAIAEAGERIRRDGLPPEVVPFVCGFTGYGHVSKAAQELYDLLPASAISPSDLPEFFRRGDFSPRTVYRAEFRKPDLYEKDGKFDLELFNADPSSFTNRFSEFLPWLTVIVNGIYWEERFPRLITVPDVKKLFGGSSSPRLRVIGDITCDIGGSVEVTVRETTLENPVYVYDVASDKTVDGWEGNGPVILAVDKLPTELPREASSAFGAALEPFVPKLAAADYTKPVSGLEIPPEFQRGLIAHQGELTSAYAYLEEFIRHGGSRSREMKDP